MKYVHIIWDFLMDRKPEITLIGMILLMTVLVITTCIKEGQNKEKCTALGGSYIDSQCLKIESISLED